MPSVVDRSIVSFDSGGRLVDAAGPTEADPDAPGSPLLTAADGPPEVELAAWHPASRIAASGASSLPLVTSE